MTRSAATRLTFSSAMAAKAAAELGDDDDELDEEPGEVIESAPPLKVGEQRVINSTSGLKKKLLKNGRGWETPVFGDEVTVHYVATLKDGTQFDSTREKGEPRTFNLGHGKVAGELDDGIATMTKGELALFTLPSGLDSRHAGAELYFEVELMSWLRVVDVSKDGGIVKKILVAGDDVQVGDLDEVQVRYQVSLLDGSVVAESPEGGLWFHVNEDHLCPAFTKCLKTMRRAEKAVVTVQPQYAFGENGRAPNDGFPAIPINAALLINIEVLSLKPVLDVTGGMKVLKKVLKSGEGIHRPNDGETARIRYTAMLDDGTLFEKLGFSEEPFEFTVDEEQVISGLDRAVATMLKGEISQVTIKPEFGFGSVDVQRSGASIPANSTLIYEVELVDFMKEKELWEMSNLQKIEAAEKAKQMGNDLYKVGKFHRAVKKYDKAVNYVNDDSSFDDGEEKLVKILRVSCWLNQAACNLKLKEILETIKLCSKVLDIEFCNVKALYRRAQAYMENGDLDLAKLDIQKAFEIDPQNREVKSLQSSLKQLQLERNRRDAKLYTNMFERMRKDTDVGSKRLKIEKAHNEEKDKNRFREMDMENPVTPEVKVFEGTEGDTVAQVTETDTPLLDASSSENEMVVDSFQH